MRQAILVVVGKVLLISMFLELRMSLPDSRSAALARRTAITKEERIFSLSSVTSPLHINANDDDVHSVRYG